MNRRPPHIRAALFVAITLITAGAARTSAQTASTVIGCGAVSATLGGTHLAATVGQSAIGFTAATFTEASQGFWFARTSTSPATTGEGVSASSILSLSSVPNPVSHSTTLSFFVPAREHVSLVLYNAIGQQMMTLLDAERDAGHVTVQADLSGLSSGSYTAILQAGELRTTTTLLLVD